MYHEWNEVMNEMAQTDGSEAVNVKGNADSTAGGQEVYRHRILELADEYINSLDDPESISGNNTIFNGLVKHIYNNYFKYNKIDYADIEYIDSIWDIYTWLCYKYNKYPTIIEFCLMINISRETVTSWKNGSTRNYIYYTVDGDRIKDFPAWRLNHQGEDYRQELSDAHSNTVKKWLAECENNLFRGAAEGNKVGCIFALKANYGYTETAPVPVANTNQRTISASEPIRLDQKDTVCSIEDKKST